VSIRAAALVLANKFTTANKYQKVTINQKQSYLREEAQLSVTNCSLLCCQELPSGERMWLTGQIFWLLPTPLPCDTTKTPRGFVFGMRKLEWPGYNLVTMIDSVVWAQYINRCRKNEMHQVAKIPKHTSNLYARDVHVSELTTVDNYGTQYAQNSSPTISHLIRDNSRNLYFAIRQSAVHGFVRRRRIANWTIYIVSYRLLNLAWVQKFNEQCKTVSNTWLQ